MTRYFLFLMLALAGFAGRAQTVAISSNSVISFASLDEARQIITNRDSFLAAQSPFDRAARLQTDRDVPPEEFRDFLGTNVMAWQPYDTNRLIPIFEGIRQKLEPWHLPFPTNILLVKTTGKEEFESYYTRQNAIICPAVPLTRPSADIFVHELFHVLSRQNPELRARL